MSWAWASLRLDGQLPKQLPTYYVTACYNVLGEVSYAFNYPNNSLCFMQWDPKSHN